MKTSNEKLESFKLAEKERLKKLHSEPVQVVVNLQDWPLPVRITYNKLSGDRILEIEELGPNDQQETSCKFRGRSSMGTGCDYLKELKRAIQGIKIKDWKKNKQYKTSYYKQH
jgi:hypothetical protein